MYICVYTCICICIMPYFVVFSLIEAQNSKKTSSQIGSYFVVFSLIAVKNNWFFYWRGSRNTQVWNPGSAASAKASAVKSFSQICTARPKNDARNLMSMPVSVTIALSTCSSSNGKEKKKKRFISCQWGGEEELLYVGSPHRIRFSTCGVWTLLVRRQRKLAT